jgi:hypothetical protein
LSGRRIRSESAYRLSPGYDRVRLAARRLVQFNHLGALDLDDHARGRLVARVSTMLHPSEESIYVLFTVHHLPPPSPCRRQVTGRRRSPVLYSMIEVEGLGPARASHTTYKCGAATGACRTVFPARPPTQQRSRRPAASRPPRLPAATTVPLGSTSTSQRPPQCASALRQR